MNITDFKQRAHKRLSSSFNLSVKKRNTLIDRYINAFHNEVRRLENSFINDDTYYISLRALRDKCNGTIDGKKKSMLKWWDENCPLYTVIKKGSNLNKKYTEIKMYYDYTSLVDIYYDNIINGKEIDRDEVLQDLYSKELYNILYSTNADELIDISPIDLGSLNNFIIFQSNSNNVEVVKRAKRIYVLAHIFDGNLLQVKSPSEFGRTFYKGPNLQNVNTGIRKAALGKCIEFDINNSVYSWRLNTVNNITKEEETYLTFPRTEEYLEFKDIIRETMSSLLTNTNKEYRLKNTKAVFTAISFGAKGSSEHITWNNGQTTLSINDILRNKDDRKAFLETDFMKEFIAEQSVISNMIYMKYKDGYKSYECIKTKQGRISKNKFLAFLYQNIEAYIMNDITSHIPKDNILLKCHDALYLRGANTEDILHMKMKLAYHNPLMSMSKTIILKWNKKPVSIDDHKAHMKQEELLAKNYKSVNSFTSDLKTPEEIEKNRLLKEKEVLDDFFSNQEVTMDVLLLDRSND